MNCIYCKQFVNESRTTDKVGSVLLWWECPRCKVFVRYNGPLANFQSLNLISMDCKYRGKDYTVYMDYDSQKTWIIPWEETDDGFRMKPTGKSTITIPAIVQNLTPTNILYKLATMINFS